MSATGQRKLDAYQIKRRETPLSWLASQKARSFHSALRGSARQQSFHSGEHVVERFFIGTQKTTKH